MKNQKGFIGLLSILIVVIIAALYMAYLFKGSWFGGINISGGNLNSEKAGDSQAPKDITGQLDDLRQNVKSLQDKKDQEILNELNK